MANDSLGPEGEENFFTMHHFFLDRLSLFSYTVEK